MSPPVEERDDAAGGAMADLPDISSSLRDDPSSSDEETVKGERDDSHIVDILEEERQTAATPVPIGNGTINNRYRRLLRDQVDAVSSEDEGSSVDGLPRRAGSPGGSVVSSIPDDSPSVQGSMVSSPAGSSILPSLALRHGLNSPTPSFRPFDRRFQSRLSSSGSGGMRSPRSASPASPAFMHAHSRNVSLSGNFMFDMNDADTPAPPWEVVRWTKLKKLNNQVFTEAGRRTFGTPTCLAVSTAIAIGTTKGIILMFDYNQNIKMIIGPGTKAAESGAITAIAISADHTTLAGGHESGNIFTWDTSRAARPFLTIPHLDQSQTQNRTRDGHMPNVSVTHLGFLGTRHTALVSADDGGMAFSHLATRGTGALGRTIKTTRILGRYPTMARPALGKPLKPSTVLAFAPLPLGNIERATDAFGLTAMLTPYLLVIVSTTPIAQTQHKASRPKDIPPHSAVTGCLAWFPAVRLKVPDPVTNSEISKVKLVYCWANVLTVVDVDEIPTDDKDKAPALRFKARNRWKCEEPIVAVQWLSRSVLTVLTITQRLIVLEDRSMRMTEGFDLVHKHIYHADLFSKQLHALVEQLDEEDVSMHGVVADAFYMSFKAYKGRIFLFGFHDISIGALSNWADRLIALMEHGDYISAIQLATSYYTGDADKLTVGLPEDSKLRHTMVKDKIMEIMSASLKYAFNQREQNQSAADDNHLRQLAETCFTTCQSVDELDFLFDDMYEWYEDDDVQGVFIETMEPYILDQTIRIVPPTVVKAMVTHFVAKGWESRLEEIICHMETATLDLDQLALLCKQHGLYDALIYVWNQALNDYITPMIDLLTLLLPIMQNGNATNINGTDDPIFGVNALKMFPYLSYVLTGRVYPTGEEMDDEVAIKAKAEIYWFLFSGSSIIWPRGSGRRFLTRTDLDSEPSFPYLRMILQFDAPSFLSALNEAFEDPFLNDSPEKQPNGNAKRNSMPEEQIFGLTVDRQYIVSILMEIMNTSDFAPEDTIYLNMFIARNLPKFPQYLLFPGSTLVEVLTGLCNYPGEDLADDAQLSAEYLLSVYHPSDSTELIPLFKKAGFYRILKRIYKSEKQYGKLIYTYFEDLEDRDGVFDCIRTCLRPNAGLTQRQTRDVHEAIRQHTRELAAEDPVRAAVTLGSLAPELHSHVLESLLDEPHIQYMYLKTLLEPDDPAHDEHRSSDRDLIEQYLRLMCLFDATHVSDYVGLVQSANLRLEMLLPTMEDTGVIDAAVVLMAREGQIQEAMERLVKHMYTLQSALQGILAAATPSSDTRSVHVQGSAEDLIQGLQKFTHVGIWLCQGQMQSAKGKRKPSMIPTSGEDGALLPEEILWLNLIDATVQITRRVSLSISSASAADDTTSSSDASILDTERLLHLLRSLVQHTFTALLTATTSTVAPFSASPAPSPLIPQSPFSFTGPLSPFSPNQRPDLKQRPSIVSLSSHHSHVSLRDAHLLTPEATPVSFLRILRAFLTRAAAASPSLADLRQVLTSIFSAYAYEARILDLSNKLLDKSLFKSVQKSATLRARGWRPRASTCEACKRRVWGPGVPASRVLEAWEDREKVSKVRREEQQAEKLQQMAEEAGETGYGMFDTDGMIGRGKGKGKGKGKKRADTSASEEAITLRVATNVNASNTADAVAGGSGNGNGNGGGGQGRGRLGGGGGGGGGGESGDNPRPPVLGPLVVFACRHVYHQACLEQLQEREEIQRREQQPRGGAGFLGVWKYGDREFRCPIDG